ncbi:hypothetical protein D9758_005075 [Tetrapyrgos nigripes]|uniref:Cytochrome P450 n=1 Tax=Tetrapyrgos nigripes TaxID=182062 RepID=A0A8H5GVX1_9AGAR|nr:hypothetical protein D9758_005075 [Tetrapyrgos nigripes]
MTSIISVFLCILTLYLFRTIRRNISVRYPPGPWGLPLLGNALQLPTVKPWHTLAKWKKTYGPLVYLNMAGQPMIILNSKKTVEDLLDRRAAKYSARPQFIVANVMTGGFSIIMLPVGERWRKMRRASDLALGFKNTVNYYTMQRNEAVFSAHSLLSDPDNWKSHIERTSSSTALSLMYDLPLIQSSQDPSIHWMNHYIHEVVTAMTPGAHLVEMLPFLQHLPWSLSKWRRDAEKFYEGFTTYFEERFRNIKKLVESGQEQRPSFCVALAENQANSEMSDRECSWLAGAIYGAAHETTATSMMWFIFCMVLFPHIQTRAQEELDKVVGRSRLPSFADFKHLPYIHAVVKEIRVPRCLFRISQNSLKVLRWRTPVPMGVPHVNSEDDYYDGYYIPKGTICVPNTWSLHHDPDIYGPDVAKFRPERHLDETGQLKDGLLGLSEGHYSYGFGQRICSGRHVANNSLFIAMATILWTMRLEGAKDSDGNVMLPDVNGEEENGILSRPPLFAITATPRFQDADTFIQEARDEVDQENLARPDGSH